MKIIKSTFIKLLILFCSFCHAQDFSLIDSKQDLKFEYFNVQSGLSNNAITDLAKDSLGYIWVSTFDGLNRYNGNEFFSFKKETDTLNTINYNFIHEIKVNSKNELLIATGEGLNIYDSKTEKFSIFDETNGLFTESLSSLEVGKQNEIIISIYGKGLEFFNPNEPEKNFHLEHNIHSEKSLSSNHISSVLLDDNTIWVGTFFDGLNKVDYQTKTVERVFIGDETDKSLNKINCLVKDENDNLWIGTRNGIVILTKDNKRIYITEGQRKQGLSDKEVLALEPDGTGNMWVGTQNGGLNIINLDAYLKHQNYIKWYLPNENGNDFQGRWISSILRDNDNSMWVGTHHGLYYINPKESAITHIEKKATTAPISINHNYVRSISESKNGNLLIGTDGGGLNIYDSKTGKYSYIKHHNNKPSSLSNNYVYDVLEDSKNRIWVATYRGGLNRMTSASGDFKKYLQGSIDNGYKVNVIFEDKQNKIWVGTNRGGLYKYNENTDDFIYITTLGTMDIRDICEDDLGNLWMATYGNGVVKYMPDSETYLQFSMARTTGIESNIMYAIQPLPNNLYLIGTGYGGLLKLDPIANKAKAFTTKHGLSNNTVNCIVYNNENDIWLGTLRGLSHFNNTTETITNLNYLDDIPLTSFNVGAAYSSTDGLLYFGSNDGLYKINPAKVFAANQDYQLIFETLKVFNNKVKVSPNNPKSILTKALPYVDHVNLNYNQTLITINFSVLKYPNAQNIDYSYIIEGYQDQWVNINQSNTINISNLPPGGYNLIVKGTINPQTTISNSLKITISPPFWKTPPAYLLYTLVLATCIWLGLRYYSERIKLKNSLIFEKKQRQLENDLNFERARFFTSFSHELKTPLSLIIAPIENLIEKIDKKKQKEQLQLVLKNSKYLLKNIQKLLEFRKTEIGLNKLAIEKVNLSEHIAQMMLSYKALAKSRNVHLKIQNTENDIFIWCDIEKIEIILHNLLSNAFKYTPKEGTISITINKTNNQLNIAVTDTGKGISKQDLPHIFDWYFQSKSSKGKTGSGIGLALSKIFAELHLGTLSVESNKNKGSKFRLQLPTDAFNESTNQNNSNSQITPEIKIDQELSPKIWAYQENALETSDLKTKINEDKGRKLILIVDDNIDILTFLSSLLEEDYDLIFAENGSDGISKAIKYVPDLVLSDVMMPLKDGFDLCKTLKKEQTTSHIPIILLTAAANPEKINEGYTEGADDYVTKPFHPKLLKTRIKNLIQTRLELKAYFDNKEKESTQFVETHKTLLDNEKAFLKEFYTIIEQQIAEQNTNVDIICEKLGMSKTSLYRKIKALTGKTINELTRKARLDKAVKLIKYDNLTVSEASFEVGFNSVKYFRKLFKEEYGKLPSELKNDL
ncbi:two-component regulator propeller domain-containing protein [Aestuariibaculum marinum]|uniref:histidine kinase n=1 Tax=Aestuariibaculum marinum TaxID=2683592 RepID=A0A8J6U4E4_9FLAO|nr:two-component regulator propeller domain-containing protein [Aestuariibaculum marinum]MBD0822854.1 response regulator [Aestuariibaculum marinum]